MDENGGTECWDRWPDGAEHVAEADAWVESLPTTGARCSRQREVLRLRAVDRLRPVGSAQKIRAGTRRGLDGRHSRWASATTARISSATRRFSSRAGPAARRRNRTSRTIRSPRNGVRTGASRSTTGPRWRKDDYAWWRQRVGGVRDLFHVFRIDHILGFYRIYSFPWRPEQNAEFLPLSARGGAGAHRRPAAAVQAARRRTPGRTRTPTAATARHSCAWCWKPAGDTRLIGEDLGTVPDYVRPSLTSLGIAGSRFPSGNRTHRTGGLLPGSEYARLSLGYLRHARPRTAARPLEPLATVAARAARGTAQARAVRWHPGRRAFATNSTTASTRQLLAGLVPLQQLDRHLHDHRSAGAGGAVQRARHRRRFQLEPADARHASKRCRVDPNTGDFRRASARCFRMPGREVPPSDARACGNANCYLPKDRHGRNRLPVRMNARKPSPSPGTRRAPPPNRPPPVTNRITQLVAQLGDIIVGKEETIRLAVDLPAGQGASAHRGHSRASARRRFPRRWRVRSGLQFRRIQFTSDLLPADIIGNSIFDREHGRFVFHPGPIFSPVLLIDEVNRATPKTQSALLEAMEEYQVSADGVTRALPQPFFVIATQNPRQQIGTFPLPESQLDRFLMRSGTRLPQPRQRTGNAHRPEPPRPAGRAAGSPQRRGTPADPGTGPRGPRRPGVAGLFQDLLEASRRATRRPACRRAPGCRCCTRRRRPR